TQDTPKILAEFRRQRTTKRQPSHEHELKLSTWVSLSPCSSLCYRRAVTRSTTMHTGFITTSSTQQSPPSICDQSSPPTSVSAPRSRRHAAQPPPRDPWWSPPEGVGLGGARHPHQARRPLRPSRSLPLVAPCRRRREACCVV
ncbi:unnamed protein product, partial [Ectocarpus fasciculatus]